MAQDTPIDLDIEKGERRQITALFYDMVGSTTMVNTMDIEDFREIQQAVHQAAHRAIAANGGHLDLLMGDGGSAYFGYPVANEDAPMQAVLAGLAILRECVEVQKDFDQPIMIRVGIATGTAVAGQAGSGALATRDEIVGIAPTLAARIQGEAGVGTVAVSNATYKATRRLFHYESLGARHLKGFNEPHALWQPLGRRRTNDRFETLRNSAQPFLARQKEFSEAISKWREAASGNGQALYVHGEPGIGKSRLCHQILEQAGKDDAHILDFQCEPASQDTPYYPVIRSLRDVLQQHDPEFDYQNPSVETIRAALALPGTHPAEFFEALAYLLAPLSPSQQGDSPNLTDFTHSAVETLADAVMAIASVKPCVMKIEDLHWADSQTLEIALQLLERIKSAPVFVIVTSRNPPDDRWHGDGHFSSLHLTRLGSASIIELIENMAGATRLPQKLVEAIATRCDGVPLFAEELTRFVIDRGADDALDEAMWEKLFDSDETASLQDLLAARLGTLGPAKFVAQAASVIGRSFNVLTLVALLSTTGAPATAEESLQELIAGGFIEQHASDAEASYRFRHMLVQQAAYSGLLRSNKRTLHSALYQIATQDIEHGSSFSSAELALHAEQAQLRNEAIKHYLDAARSASSQSALQEARALLKRAELLTAKLKDKAAASSLNLEILKLLGPVVAMTEGAGSDAASKLYQKGVELLHEQRDGDRASGFPLYWGWWFTAPNFKVQRERAELLLADLAGSNNQEVELQALHCRWATAFNTGQHTDCLNAITKGLELYSEDEALDHRTRYGGHDARVCGLGERALSSWFMGHTETALTHLEQAEHWARHIDHVGSNCHALDIGIMLHRYRGDIDQVARLARQMRDTAKEHDLKSLEAKSLIFGGWANGMAGDPLHGREALAQGLAIQQEIGTEEDFPVYLEMAAELDGQLGKQEDGLRLVSSAIERAEEAGHAFWLAELYRRRARLTSTTAYDEKRIAEDLARAEEISAQQGATVLTLRTLVDKARILPDKMTGPELGNQIGEILQDLENGRERERALSLLAGILA
ncbi:AAA family ATPase [uncultured Roseibium sp.]|uniref:AAA family ATPase n=1 Tax=uncultured Roseibium sp. TaxID=1936171 RepID=UPI00261BD8AC|nr:AAA family ATPase [uncultured Roseibium sp.]